MNNWSASINNLNMISRWSSSASINNLNMISWWSSSWKIVPICTTCNVSPSQKHSAKQNTKFLPSRNCLKQIVVIVKQRRNMWPLPYSIIIWPNKHKLISTLYRVWNFMHFEKQTLRTMFVLASYDHFKFQKWGVALSFL